MALPTITLVNTTGGAITLEQLAVTVPASGSIDVSDFDAAGDVLNDAELQVEMDAGNIRINITGGGLSSSDTNKTLEQSKSIVKPIHDLDIKCNLSGTTAPVATDDEDSGYSVGSIWVDETGDLAYVCVDATSTAAVWNQAGGSVSRIAQNGIITESLRFFIDFNNQSSWVPNQATTWTDTIAGVVGTASDTAIVSGHLNFDGADSDVNFGTLTAALEDIYENGGTVMFWIRPNTDGETSLGRIVDTINISFTNGWTLCTSGESGSAMDLTLFQHYGAGFARWDTTSTELTIDAWTHCAVSFDSLLPGTQPVMTINGSAVGVTTTTVQSAPPSSDSGNDLNIGNSTGNGQTFDGDIEIVGIYDTALSSSEVLDIYNATKARFGSSGDDWASSLVAGNISGGTDAVMSVGDFLRGVDATSGSAFDLAIRGGTTTDTAASVDGGDLLLTGGSTGSTSFVGSANGGHVRITGGGTSGAGAALGGGVFITGATPTNDSGTGGSITIASGDGAAGGGVGANAGDVSITTGDGANTGASGGSFSVILGESAPGSGAAGSITMTAGANPGTTLGTPGGDVTITSGTSLGRTGSVFIRSGDNLDTPVPGSTNTIGGITIETGSPTGGSTTFTGGPITITSQGDTSGGVDFVIGASVSIAAGNTGAVNFDGGDISFTAGDTNGFNQRIGGNVTLTCGAELGNGSSASEGGSVVMVPGTSVSGHDGMARIDGTGTLQMLERSAVVTGITATEGRWWVRDDAPNVPMFTDDAGMDWVLNETGAADLQEAYEGGSTILVSVGEGGPVAISGTPDDASTLLTLTGGTHAGAIADRMLTVVNNVLTTATAVEINNVGSGSALVVQDDGNTVLDITGAGAVTVTPRLNEDFTVTTTATGNVDINAGTSVTIDAVFGGISLDATGGSNFSCTGGNLLLSGLSLNITALGANAPGDIVVTGSTAAGLGNDGGNITATAGGGDVGGTGGQVVFTAGTGGSSGTGGKASFTGGLGGGTSGSGGAAAVAGGAPTDGDGGAVSVTGADGVGTNRSGGTATLAAGDSTGTANGAAAIITGGDGGATSGTGGGVNIDAGAPLDGIGGSVTINATSGVGTNRAGGGISLGGGDGTGTAGGGVIGGIAGDGGVSGNGGPVTFLAGDSGASAGAGGDVTITAGDGEESGGDVDISSGGSTNAANPGGDVTITAGGGTGTSGGISLITEDDGGIANGSVTIRTTSGFTSQGERHYTYGTSDEVTNTTTNQTVLTLGTLSANGSNLKIIVRLTAQDTGDDSNFVAYKYEQYFYRDGGTVTGVTAFEDQAQIVGTADFTSNVSFDVAVAGDNILLRVTNDGGSGTEDFTLDMSVILVSQLGGLSS